MPGKRMVTVEVSDELADRLPADPTARQHLLELGLREWMVEQALADFQAGRCSLAAAAHKAGVSLREIVPMAYARGLAPKVDPELLRGPMSLEQASKL